MKRNFSLLLCAALSGGLGVGAGWWMHDLRDVSSTEPRRFLRDPEPALRSIVGAGGSLANGTGAVGWIDRVRDLIAWVEGVGPGGYEAALRRCAEWRRAEPFGEAGLAWKLLWMRWAESDPAAALAASVRMDPEGEATAAVMLAAARTSPQTARAQLEEVRGEGKSSVLDGPHGARLAATVAREWWRQEKEAALAWVKKLPEGVRVEAWGAVVGVAAMEDAAAASVMVAEMPAGHERELASARVAEIWAGHSPVEAMAWVGTLSDEDRRRAGPQALIAWVETDAAGAAGYLVDSQRQLGSVGASPHLLLDIAAVAGTWAKRDPVQAAGWVARQPEGAVKSEAMEHLLWHWTAAAPEEASRWLDAQPAGAARDKGMAMLAQHTAPTDPAAATAWAAAMTPSPARDAALQSAVAAWMRKDHAAAKEWLEKR